MDDIADQIESLRQRGVYRKLRLVSGPQGPRVLLDGKPVLLLCSSNYLGLADHPRVREAASEAAMRWGVGTGASRLVSGNMTVHRRLEEDLAAFLGSPACVLFGSGYLASLGLIGALARQGEVVFSDRLNPPSIADACRLARAETFVYEHCDTEHLEWGLQRAGGRVALIVTQGLFSVDGALAPLERIVELARRSGARVAVDEADAIGTIGPLGRGAVAAAGLDDEVDVVLGTLGKALGSYGAHVCCDGALAKYLLNRARTLIHSTSPPPPAIAGARAALELLIEQPGRVEKLHRNARVMREALASEGVDTSSSGTHVVPLVIGDAAQSVAASDAAVGDGVLVEPILPPAIPDARSGLRLAVMSSHTRSELRSAARVVAASVVSRSKPAREEARDPAKAQPPRIYDGFAEAA